MKAQLSAMVCMCLAAWGPESIRGRLWNLEWFEDPVWKCFQRKRAEGLELLRADASAAHQR